MVKAKSIKIIQEEVKKCKKLLNKATNPLDKLKLEIRLKELQWNLEDIKYQLTRIDVQLHRDADFYKSLFVDRYIYGLTQKQLLDKYNIYSTNTLYRKLNIAKEVFEGKKASITLVDFL